MRKEISGQVRRTFGGGERPGASEVWDTATNEIPPEVGESPECQWCPICRAARRMRDSGPGLGGQLSGAGDAVASAVQDAVSALDSILGKAGGNSQQRAGGSSQRSGSGQRAGDSSQRSGSGQRAGYTSQPRGSGTQRTGSSTQPTGGSDRASSPAGTAGTPGSAPSGRDRGADGPGSARPGADATDTAEVTDPHGPVTGDHGPGGWKPGDRLATAHIIDGDPWAGATEADDGSPAGPGAGRPADEGRAGDDGRAGDEGRAGDQGEADGRGHGPDDRS
jgi:hypothetical protein